jgi:thiol-disulfide isomerase/thioredoxin
MAQTPSTMLPLGTKMPQFSLPDSVTGQTISSDRLRGTNGTLVMFICNHCPFVQHVLPELGRLARDYAPKRVGFVAINANDLAAHPEDGPEHMKALAIREGWSFRYLMDETQEVAKAYQAACTPDFFLFDANDSLVYRGRLDESRPKSGIDPTGKDVRAALDAVLAGRAVDANQQPSVGCNIKWKVGSAPAYFHIAPAKAS